MLPQQVSKELMDLHCAKIYYYSALKFIDLSKKKMLHVFVKIKSPLYLTNLTTLSTKYIFETSVYAHRYSSS